MTLGTMRPTGSPGRDGDVIERRLGCVGAAPSNDGATPLMTISLRRANSRS